ncbi:MAG: hypothetical protein WD022_01595 [Balneolaceae bacterium]
MKGLKKDARGNIFLSSFIIILFGFLIIPECAFSQDTEFEKWKKQQQQEFKEYQDQFDKEFIEMLEKTWEEVGINEGSEFYRERKPVNIPKAPPKPTVENYIPKDDTPIREKVVINIPDASPPQPIKIEIPAGESLFGDIATKTSSLNYFSTTIPIEYPAELQELFSPREFSTSKTDNDKIAGFWDKVSRIDHAPIINYSDRIREELQLNDWGYILLINNIANTVYSGYDKKLVNLYNWFLLTRAGYKVRVGYDQVAVYILFAAENNVFNTKYYTLDGEQFYIIDLNDRKQSPSSIFTYSGSHQGQNKKLNLNIDSFPNLGDSKNLESKTLSFSYNGNEYTVPVSIDRNIITYFEYFPLTELPIFFKASLTEASKKSIYETLAPVVSEMNEEEAVNFILRFVQTAFEYKTDQDQFDREKYMLPEETLFYPYSDCDDRSILFANLVQELTGLEVVGLRYSKHLATAVAFSSNEVEGDHHNYRGKKYIVADPTYINAPVGLTMAQYKNEKPEIISLQ